MPLVMWIMVICVRLGHRDRRCWIGLVQFLINIERLGGRHFVSLVLSGPGGNVVVYN